MKTVATMICCQCDHECVGVFMVGAIAVCPECAFPCRVVFLCMDGHAHTVEYDPCMHTPRGRGEALWMVRAMLKAIPKAPLLTDKRHKEKLFQEAEETEKLLKVFFQ